MYSKSLELKLTASGSSSDSDTDLVLSLSAAVTMVNIGAIHKAMGDYSKALHMLSQALSIRKVCIIIPVKLFVLHGVFVLLLPPSFSSFLSSRLFSLTHLLTRHFSNAKYRFA